MDGVYAEAVKDFISGVHQPNDTYLLALYDEEAVGDTYNRTLEITGQGYERGGKVLQGYAIKVTGNLVSLRFNDVMWANSTISGATGGVIYNQTKGNRVLRHITFDEVYTSRNGPLEVFIPAAGVVCFMAAVDK